MTMTSSLFIVLVCSTSLGFSIDAPAPVYTINLDLPPEERWVTVMADYSAFVHEFINDVFGSLPKIAVEAANVIGDELEKFISDPYAGEIRGAAKHVNVSVGEAVLFNLVYELTAYRGAPQEGKACTSIVAESSEGKIFHGRNLDYDFEPATLRKGVIVVNFQSKGITQYTGTTFAGYVGLVTGQKPNKFTVSLDARDKGEPWENVFAALITGSQGIVSFQIRSVLADPNSDYASALEHLSSVTLITPSYIILGGAEPTQGAVITRDRTAALDVWSLAPMSGRWYLVETNYDHWTPPPANDDRRDPVIRAMNATGRAAISGDTLFKVLSISPVLNDGTTYTNIMSAAKPDLYHAVIRSP